MQKFFRLFSVTFIILALSALALAQSTTTGAIEVKVQDPNGAVIPNAAVSVRNVETNKEVTATTDDEGRTRVVNLQPGTYVVTVNASGFGTFTQERVVVEVGVPTPIEADLAVGQTTGQVEVTSEAPVINTSQQDFSNNINQTSINELPINGRRWSNFALLTPAAVPDGNFGLISFRGISGLLNNNTIDGGDNNQAFFSEERGRTRINYVISQASIREFQVNASNYSAEYGRAAGGVVNAVTKSGTNEFHGSAFYYLRDNKFGARNPRGFVTVLVPVGGRLVPDVAPIKPVDKRQQFGGTIGGPIVKDHLFFFFSYDEQRRNFPGIATTSDARFFTTVNRPTLTARGLTNAQIDAGVAFLQSLTGEVSRRGDQRIFLPKIDWVITPKHSFTATYNRMRWNSPRGIQTQPTVNFGVNSFGDDFVEVDSLNLRLTSTLMPMLLNEARFQYGRDKEFQISQPPASGEPTTGPNGRPPQISITGGFTFGKPNFLERKSYPDEKRWQYADTMTLTRGNHILKFGADINHVNDLLDNLFTEEGSYSYSNINDYLIDYVNAATGGSLRTAGALCSSSTRRAGQCYSGNYTQGFGPTAFQFSTNDFNFFVQDDFRVTPRLTLNLGLRYEYEQLPEPQIPNSLPNLPGQFIGPEQTRTFPSDKNNFGPRFGFAYDITGDGKTSVRGGYGIYYGRIINSTISNAITNTGVAAGQRTFIISPSSPAAPIYPNTLAAATGSATPSIIVFSPLLAAPQIHQGDLIFEREVARNTVVSASLLFGLGRRLPTFIDRNLRFPTLRTYTIVGGDRNGQTLTVPFFATPRPDTRFGAITEVASIIESEYEALVLQANRRLTNGLQFQVSYTRSRATDTGQSSQTFTATNAPLNPYDLSLDEARTSFDVPHKFVASAVWTPDFFGKDQKVGRAIFNGFNIAPVVIVASGVPYSPTTSGNPAGGVSGSITASGSNASGGNFTYVPFIFGRNSFRQPKIVNVDLRISRRFRFTEDMNLEVLAEGFNIFNRTQVTSVNTRLYSIGGTAGASTLTFDPAFGTTSAAGNTLARERQIQFAVRFEF